MDDEIEEFLKDMEKKQKRSMSRKLSESFMLTSDAPVFIVMCGDGPTQATSQRMFIQKWGNKSLLCGTPLRCQNQQPKSSRFGTIPTINTAPSFAMKQLMWVFIAGTITTPPTTTMVKMWEPCLKMASLRSAL